MATFGNTGTPSSFTAAYVNDWTDVLVATCGVNGTLDSISVYVKNIGGLNQAVKPVI